MFQAGVGAPVPVEILSRCSWTAGHSLVVDQFRKGRVFLGGDAAHLFTPAGGLGYNTAVEDAVNLGWKLASVIKGCASPTLLDSYEAERRPLAVRNTGYAKKFADSLGLFKPVAEIEDDTPAGAAARSAAGIYFEAHGKAEFNIPGVTFGGRYDHSTAIVYDGSSAPPDASDVYTPTASPGGRPPHLWLSAERSLYDEFGFEWTLLDLGVNNPATGTGDIYGGQGIDVKVVHVPQARDLYEANFALIRPDQVVAWRGNSREEAALALGQILGTTH
jgi:hypothetical protein